MQLYQSDIKVFFMIKPIAKSLIILIALCIMAACGNAPKTTVPTSTTSEPVLIATVMVSTPPTTVAPAGIWENLLLATPFPLGNPLPAAEASPLDGIYAKVDPSPPQWWTCYRCADYRPMGGIWRLQFDKGVLRIYYEVTDYGGYIEVTGFEPGEHTIRVENLAFDHHPIKVAAFGFSSNPIGK